MALTSSNMLPLGTPAPDFTLPDTVSGQKESLQHLKSDKATVVMFICNHCPFVLHIRKKLVEVAQQYQKRGVSFIAISSNDVENYPQDGPDKMQLFAKENHFSFPYLYDESQAVAQAYQAACTPEFYVFNKALLLVYRGQFDESSPGKPTPVTGEALTGALDNILANKAVDKNQKPSLGCNIKWK